MRVVFDTSLVVAALRSPDGASRALLRSLRRGQVKVLCSVALFLEYEAVLTRPEQLQACRLSTEDVAIILDAVASLIEPVEMTCLWRPQLSDPDDELVLETAVNGHADFIATFNLKHLKEASARFGIEALTPGELVRRYPHVISS